MSSKPDFSFDPQILIGLRRIVGTPINTETEKARAARYARRERKRAKREAFAANYFVKSDAARSIPNESKDCTVRALTHATGLPYDICHAVCRSYGRANGRAMGKWFQTMLEAERGIIPAFASKRFVRVFDRNRGQRATLENWTRCAKPGRYIVDIRQHVFAVIDGCIHDVFLSKSMQRVNYIWRIFDAEVSE